jgi:thiamine biosynthesis protein ThiS
MKVTVNVNGNIKELDGSSDLEALVLSVVEKDNNIIAEVNDRIVKRNAWKDHTVREGDQIRLIHLVGGG